VHSQLAGRVANRADNPLADLLLDQVGSHLTSPPVSPHPRQQLWVLLWFLLSLSVCRGVTR
jgi:hypothetical protein